MGKSKSKSRALARMPKPTRHQMAGFLSDQMMSHALGQLSADNVRFLQTTMPGFMEKPPSQFDVHLVTELAKAFGGLTEVKECTTWAELAELARENIINHPRHMGLPGKWQHRRHSGYFAKFATDMKSDLANE